MKRRVHNCDCGHAMRMHDQSRCERCGTGVLFTRIRMQEWDESQHPREADGKFAPAGGGSDTSEPVGRDNEFNPNSGKFESISSHKPYSGYDTSGEIPAQITTGPPEQLPGGVTKTTLKDAHRERDNTTIFKGPGGAFSVQRQYDMYMGGKDSKKPFYVKAWTKADEPSQAPHGWYATRAEAETVAAGLVRGPHHEDRHSGSTAQPQPPGYLDSDEVLSGKIIEHAIRQHGADWLGHLAKIYAPKKAHA